MARGRKKGAVAATIEEQIEKAQEKVIRTKAAYESAVESLQKCWIRGMHSEKMSCGMRLRKVAGRMMRSSDMWLKVLTWTITKDNEKILFCECCTKQDF